MLNFNYYSPTRLIFGRGEENNVGKYLKSNGATKVMLFYYGTGMKFEDDLIDQIETSLKGAGLECIKFAGIQPNPTKKRSMEAARTARETGADYMLAVGGGSVIDTAKYASVQAVYEGDLWKDCFLRRDLPVPQKRIPVATIVTLAGAGSEASEACLIKDEETGLKYGIDNEIMRPVFSILNPELTFTVPKYPTACGIADILCHLSESYFTRTDDGDLMNEYIEGLMRTVIKYSEVVMREPDNYLARAQILFVSTMANWHLTWCGREDDGAVHCIQEPIPGRYNSAHGHCCAVITIGWMRYVYKTDIWRFVRYFTRIWNIPHDELHPEAVIEAGFRKLEEFYSMIGLETTLKAIGVKQEDIPELASLADKRPHGKTGNFVKLDTEDIIKIYGMCNQ